MAEIPENAVNMGGGAFAVRKGYKNLGMDSLELPTVRGNDESITQDEEEDNPLVVKKIRFDQNGSVDTGQDSGESHPAQDDPMKNPEVDSVGSALDAGGSPTERSSTADPVIKQSQEQPDQAPSVQASPTVRVDVGHESGLKFSMSFDLVVVTEPVEGTSTVVLGINPEQTISIPSGQYTLRVDGEDEYRVFFGNQTFEHYLRYYVFILQEEE